MQYAHSLQIAPVCLSFVEAPVVEEQSMCVVGWSYSKDICIGLKETSLKLVSSSQ
jgi:hypothetical protein